MKSMPASASVTYDQYEATFDTAASGPTTKKPRSDFYVIFEVTDKPKDKFYADAVHGRDLRFILRSDTMPRQTK